MQKKEAIKKATVARVNKENLQTSTALASSSSMDSHDLKGSRIMNVAELQKSIEVITSHSAQCGGTCTLEGESMHSGLAVVFRAVCSKCSKVFSICSSPRVVTQKGKKWSVNLGAVLGQMSTGGGLNRLNATLALLDVPGMYKRMFAATEALLGMEMMKQLATSMQKVATEEREHAINMNSYHQGIPAITVVVDGGWSKRSHKHSYNAKSGVAVIFGRHTKRLLHLGVRNKFCSVCAISTNKACAIPTHTCYKNWTGSSAAMESDIIAEGFRLSEQLYGLRYMFVIGDGDSSVMATICQSVLYGVYVNKIECANHACKAYRSRLEALAKDNPQFRGKGGLTKKAIQRLTIGARMAIKMHSSTHNINQLRHDLRNGPSHVFGDHSNCTSQFCTHRTTVASTTQEDSTDPVDNAHISSQPTTFVDQLDDIIEEEVEAASEEDEHDARLGGSTSVGQLPQGLFSKVMACGDRLVMLAPQLVSNETSNLAECYMSVRCNFDGGKQYNRVQGGAFQHRCNAAGLQVQHGREWPLSFWQETTGSPPGSTMTAYVKSREKQLEKDRTRKQSAQYKLRRTASKRTTTDNSQHHYGPNSQQPDPSKEELDHLCTEYYSREVVTCTEDAAYVEAHTRQQSEDRLWFHQRRLRLTASNFGKVAKRRDTTLVANLVKTLLYGKVFSTAATRWGLSHEEDVRAAYIQYLHQQGHSTVTTSSSGLVIDLDEPCLACSPDGLVDIPKLADPRGIYELKCPHTLAKESMTPQAAAASKKDSSVRLAQLVR